MAGSGLTAEQRREIYPSLQKRLDDSNDEIRIRAASCCRAFFGSLAPEGYDDANSEYFTTAVVVHMDDADPRVQVSFHGPKNTASRSIRAGSSVSPSPVQGSGERCTLAGVD